MGDDYIMCAHFQKEKKNQLKIIRKKLNIEMIKRFKSSN